MRFEPIEIPELTKEIPPFIEPTRVLALASVAGTKERIPQFEAVLRMYPDAVMTLVVPATTSFGHSSVLKINELVSIGVDYELAQRLTWMSQFNDQLPTDLRDTAYNGELYVVQEADFIHPFTAEVTQEVTRTLNPWYLNGNVVLFAQGNLKPLSKILKVDIKKLQKAYRDVFQAIERVIAEHAHTVNELTEAILKAYPADVIPPQPAFIFARGFTKLTSDWNSVIVENSKGVLAAALSGQPGKQFLNEFRSRAAKLAQIQSTFVFDAITQVGRYASHIARDPNYVLLFGLVNHESLRLLQGIVYGVNEEDLCDGYDIPLLEAAIRTSWRAINLQAAGEDVNLEQLLDSDEINCFALKHYLLYASVVGKPIANTDESAEVNRRLNLQVDALRQNPELMARFWQALETQSMQKAVTEVLGWRAES
jgi:hypothetical protein